MANTVSAELLIGGVFTAKTAFIEEGIELKNGPDVETGTQPAELTLTWDNSDLSMDPSNVVGPLYGKIGRNTQTRLKVGGTVLQLVEASSWGPDTSPLFTVSPPRGRSWTEFSGRGLLSRMGRWTEPLRSPLYSQIISYPSLLGYWPMEGDTTVLTNPIPAGIAGTALGSNSTNDGPGGSGEVIQLGSDGNLQGTFSATAVTNGWQVCWTAQVPNAVATRATIFQWTTSNGLTYEWTAGTADLGVVVTRNVDGVVLSTTSSGWGGTITPGQWIRYRLKCTVAGSVVTIEPAWYAQDALSIFGFTNTFAGTTTGQPRAWRVVANGTTNGAAYGHAFAVTDTTLDLTGAYDAVQAFNGYQNETAGGRFLRLMGQVGLTRYIGGTTAETAPMGRQKPGVLLDLLEECARTDGALIYDEPSDIALMFRTRRNRYGQTSHLDLTKGTNVAPPLKKIIDDVGAVNRITVSNATGVSVTKTLTAGAMSILAPPAGVGEYKGTLDVNYASDGDLDPRAGWELNKGTLPRPRYKQVTVDLLANPGLITACNSIRPGDLITVAGVEPDPVLLHVLSYVHNVGHTTRTFVMNCVPGDLWGGPRYDDGVTRYTVRSSTVNTAMTTTSTALSVLLTDPLDTWSTTATGYDLVLNDGERVRVTTAFSAPVGLVQSGAVVTRSMNGVVVAHGAGEPIQMYRAARYVH